MMLTARCPKYLKPTIICRYAALPVRCCRQWLLTSTISEGIVAEIFYHLYAQGIVEQMSTTPRALAKRVPCLLGRQQPLYVLLPVRPRCSRSNTLMFASAYLASLAGGFAKGRDDGGESKTGGGESSFGHASRAACPPVSGPGGSTKRRRKRSTRR